MQTEPCCLERCRYSPRVVRRVLRLLDPRPPRIVNGQAEDRCTLDELESVLTPSQGYDTDRLGGFGPNAGPTWRLYVADLERARKAGCRTPEQVAQYLCPFWAMGDGEDDDLLDAA